MCFVCSTVHVSRLSSMFGCVVCFVCSTVFHVSHVTIQKCQALRIERESHAFYHQLKLTCLVLKISRISDSLARSSLGHGDMRGVVN